MKRFTLVVSLAMLLALATRAQALPIGALAFDALVPGPGGLNTFSITNLTGAFALPPDFPVITDTLLQNAHLQVDTTGGPLHFDLGDIGPGPFLDPLGLLIFPDTVPFTRALLTATLDPRLLQLADGTQFSAARSIGVTLLPATGLELVAGADFVLIEAAPAAVPAPSALTLAGSGFAALWIRTRRKRSGRARATSACPIG